MRVARPPARALAAWLLLQDPDGRAKLLSNVPASLRASLSAYTVFPSKARQLALAARGRQDLARGFQRQLARAGTSFVRVVAPAEASG